MNDELKTWHTEDVVCPYCGLVFSDSWELAGNSDGEETELECGDCNKKFTMITNIRMTFTTIPLETEQEQSNLSDKQA